MSFLNIFGNIIKNLGSSMFYFYFYFLIDLVFILCFFVWCFLLLNEYKTRIIFCITNEISFTIISLSSSDKFFLESWFFIRNYYYITNYYRNLLRFTLYIRS